MNPDNTYFWYTFFAGVLLSGAVFALSMKADGFSLRRAAVSYSVGILLALCLGRFFYAVMNRSGISMTDPKGFSFAAGSAGFCFGPALVCLKNRDRIPALLDSLALPGCLLAAFTCFGEVFCGQLGLADPRVLGLPDIEEGSLLARFPFAVADDWDVWYLSVSTLAAILILAVAVYAFFLKRRSGQPAGVLFDRCAFLLCAIRCFLDLTRIESFVLYFVHVEQVLCTLIMLLLMIRACVRREKAFRGFPVLPLILTILCFAINGVTQYLMDKPWVFEPVIPERIFAWLNDNLETVGFALLLLTTAVPVVLHGYLCNKTGRG